MRNISLTNFESYRLSHLNHCQVFCCYRNVFYGYDKGKIIKCQENNCEVLCSLTASLYPKVDPNDDILKALQLTYFYEKDFLYLVLLSGDIISLDLNEKNSEAIVGSLENGIVAFQWSPDQELIALVSLRLLVVLSNDFEPIKEVDLHDGGFGENQIVSVGWGKKETQFRGSEGKFKFKEDEKETINDHSQSIKISWRGDGEYFVISCINPETNLRYLRIFNKYGVIQYTSEDLNGLEDTLCWKPSGSLITSTQKFPNKYNVCFIEKNGLKHGEFTLPLNHNKIKVLELFWNKDSKLLAVLISKIIEIQSNKTNTENSSDKIKYIQIYSVNNYHWYCKYTINIDKISSLLLVEWDNQKYNTLHTIVKRGNDVYHNKYTWVWVVNKSKGNSENDESFVAVIDGCNLKLTSFKKGIIPPPMSTYEIKMSSPINLITFGHSQDSVSSNDFLVQLSDNSLVFYKFLPSNGKVIGHELAGTIELNNENEHNIFYNIQWISSRKIIVAVVKVNEIVSKPFLTMISIDESEESQKNYQKIEIPLQSTVSLLRAGQNAIVAHNNDGKTYLFNEKTHTLNILFSLLNTTFIQLDVVEKMNKNLYVLGLDSLNKFYLNEKMVFNNILSFLVHGTSILITNMKHELLCFDISEIDNISNVFKRRIERGSRLITSIYKDMKVILQMPRGNLECIQPRALSIKVLGDYLNNKKYFEAFDLMKKQRINFNLIYDHNPNLFSKNSNIFVEQVRDPQSICLFVSELIEEDVTKTMYAQFYKQNEGNLFIGENKAKIEFVCELIENSLMNIENSEKFILPILTCYIKRGKTEFLETALSKLKKIKEKEMNGEKPLVPFDEAFRYVLYLIDVQDLYKIALGMYDLDLALIVASKSQMDPKEYIPFLNDLKKLEEHYKKFIIDKYLKKYKKALINLVKCDGDKVFDECINFVKTYKLYKDALKIIPKNTDKYKTLCIIYAEELMKSNLYEEAGLMYANGGIFEKSIEAFKKSGNWEEALICIKHLKKSDDELFQLYLDLAMILSESKKFKESATIYLDYLGDVSECVESLISGKLFAEAYRICYLHNKADLINKRIVPAILEYASVMGLQIENFRDTFINQKKRLELVRKLKAEGAENRGEAALENDLYSEAGSTITYSHTGSRTTNRTYRSAKNKRKHERKLLSLKEGSPYEDLALINSLYNIVTNCLTLKSEIRELNKQLLKINEFEIAETLQNELEKLLKTIENSKSEIWVPEFLSVKHNYGPEATSNQVAGMYSKSENEMPLLLNPRIAFPPDTQTNLNWKLKI